MKFAVIIADPPWEYDSPRALVGNGGRGDFRISEMTQVDVSAHYKTMSLEEICSLQLPAADNSFLFMWITNPFLCDGSGVKVVKAWGFVPKTIITWAKIKADAFVPSMKTGHWFRSASEHVIFAVRGACRRPIDYPALPTWFAAPRGAHSVKPDRIHEYAELIAPQGPWLEMFARRSRPGWYLWGNEVPVEMVE